MADLDSRSDVPKGAWIIELCSGGKRKAKKNTNTVVDSPTAVVIEVVDVLEVVALLVLKSTNDDALGEVVILLEYTDGDVGIEQGSNVGAGRAGKDKITNRDAGIAAVQGESVRTSNVNQ